MPSLPALLCAFVALLGVQEPSRFGKSDGQILAMGLNGWSDFYSLKAGSSTMAMVDANTIYHAAAKRRTDREAKGKPAATRTRIESLLRHMKSFADNTMQAGYAIAGGGTIWSIFMSASPGLAEDALFAVLAPRGKVDRPAPSTVSAVRKELNSVRKQIPGIDESLAMDGYGRKEALAFHKKAELALEAIGKITASLSARERGLILGYCAQRVRVVSRDWE